jgi:tRNA nucleotidyltransferase (CCA-adding enzyme)
MESQEGTLKKPEITQICEQILQEVRPNEEERNRISITVSKVINRLKSQIKLMGIDAYPELEGSVAHGTWISGERDIDIFVIFPLQTPLDELKKIGLELGKKASEGDWRERYAEHPFIEAKVDGYRIDIVPCYKISKFSERVTSVDRTPLHTEYLSKSMKEDVKDEVILLKAFMKGIGVYGAELRIRGFSGYLCELLILHYGSFEGVLKGVLRWEIQHVIDLEKYYGDKETPKAIFSEPLIFIDPIDATRNVAAAVSIERIGDVKGAVRAFLTNPSAKFFKPKSLKPMKAEQLRNILRDRGTDTLFVTIPCQRISPDILWGELTKSSKALKKLLELHDFRVLNYDSWSDEDTQAVIVVELTSADLPLVEVHEGPEAGNPNQDKFLDKHICSEKRVAGPWIKDGRWQVELKRDFTNAKQFIEEKLAKEDPMTLGISKDIGKWIKEGAKIALNEEVISFYSANSRFAEFLTKYFEKRPNWLL